MRIMDRVQQSVERTTFRLVSAPYIAASFTNLKIYQKFTDSAELCSTVENIKTQPIKKGALYRRLVYFSTI
ncbi:hypothetical protein AA81_13025 [Petrotoga halophila DSM 16923]|uniref:Uncharacterized protein n=1 Tax=Petrotoga halophila DSM 16923 TaxID=1122953 RepID=A0A2S5E976_9BACT|nr:hypothetical protein AA81_13025 [Petrotoga halophila DSM 16923]